jgi:hypothetical protein
MIRLHIAALLCFALTGCVAMDLAKVEEAQRRLKCGMSQKQVEVAIQAPISKMEVPSQRLTHLYRVGSADLWLVFENDKLVSSTLLKIEPLFGVKEEASVNHCRQSTNTRGRFTLGSDAPTSPLNRWERSLR